MELAVVIPYFRRTFFETTLESLACQTDKRFKVYIGDDASPDDPSGLLENYKNRFDFVYRRFETNLGGTSLVKQWERCLALVQSEKWVMILGDDDVLATNAIEAFHKKNATAENAKVFRFATQVIDQSGAKITDVYTHPDAETSVDFIFRKSRSSLSEYVFDNVQVKQIRFKDLPLAWFSDVLGVLEFSDFGPVHTINDAVVYVRVSGESISGTHQGFARKNAAAFAFYAYLLTEKKHHFTRTQRDILLQKINKCYRNDKKNVGAFLKLSGIYLGGFDFSGYFNFLKLVVVSVKNKQP